MHMLKFCLLLCSLVIIVVNFHVFSVLFLKIFMNVKSRDGNRAAVAKVFYCADIL
jgi:hypothetical protein